MSVFKNKKRLILAYCFIILLSGAIFIIDRYFALAPWFLLIVLFYLIFVPGFSLSRIFKIEFSNDRFGQLLLWMTIGFTFNFLICFIAIILGWTLSVLVLGYLLIFVIVFCLAIIFDTLRPVLMVPEPYNLKIKDIFNKGNIIYYFLFIFIILILITIDEQGSNFKGDPYFHLVIMRKVLGGMPLSPEGLNFIKTAQIHPAYGFPVWHTFLTMIAVLIKSNIFTVWAEITLPLSILVMMTWYWLYRKIFLTRDSAVLGFLLFVVFTYEYTYGYFFTRLAVPDTLCQFLIMPLIVALSVKYIFDRTVSYKVLVTFSLLSLLMAAIHVTQYFYFMMIMIVLAICYVITKFRDPEFKVIFKRILWTIFTNVIIVLPFIGLLEYHGKVVSTVVKLYWQSENYKQRFSKSSFAGGQILAKYAYLAAPLTLLFIKKYRKVIFLFALFLVVPIVYSRTIVFVQYYIIRILGIIFFNRIYANITWPHALWGFFLGFIMVIIDRLISRVTRISIVLRVFIDVLLATCLVWMIIIEQKYSAISNFYNTTIASKNIFSWINDHYLWLLTATIFLTAILLIWQRFSDKFYNLFTYKELENRPTALIITIIIVFFLFSVNYKNLVHLINLEFTQKYFFITSRDHTYAAVNPTSIGGMETADFINKNIPAKSIFLTNKSASTTLPMLTDQYMAAYPRTQAEKQYKRIYYEDMPIEEKLKYLAYSKVEYIFLTYPDKEGEVYFNKYPEYFTLVYHTGVAIYKVDTERANRDYQRLVQEDKISNIIED